MDCRNALVLGLSLLGGAAGCQQVGVTPAGSPSTAVTRPETTDLAQSKKTPEAPHRQPPPAACVAYGDFMTAEAATPGVTPLAQQEMQEVARKAYQKGITLDPKDMAAYRGLARLYQQMGDHAHAVATYRKALEMAPKDASLWLELGMCYNRKKDWAPALECLAKAVELEPENRRCVDMLGYTLARAGRYDDSVACFARIGGEAKAHYNVARMLQHLQQPELARQHLQLALQQDANLTNAQQLLNELNGRPAQPVHPVSYEEQSPASPGVASPLPATAATPATPGTALPAVAVQPVNMAPVQLPAATVTPPPGS